MKVLRIGDVQDYWFNGYVAKCPECNHTVEFTSYDLDKLVYGWFGEYMKWECPNATCSVKTIRTLKKPWYREVFDEMYADITWLLDNSPKKRYNSEGSTEG